MRKRKILLYFFVLLVVLAALLVFICNSIITKSAKGRLYSSAASIPYNKVGLLLGTSKFLERGAINPYYQYRIQAAVRLLKAGKIDYIVVSGDNSRKDYNEPEMMRNDLVEEGIDATRIFLDYAGLRTFDSMVRVKEVFGQQSVTVISQPFHNERALYIADREGISAIGYNARDVGAAVGFNVRVREKLARVKVFIDYIIGKEPKFGGKKVVIPG
jgi:SanA protein